MAEDHFKDAAARALDHRAVIFKMAEEHSTAVAELEESAEAKRSSTR